MIVIDKYDYELFRIGHNFRRKDGTALLAADEVLSSASVQIVDENDADVTASMLDGSPTVQGTYAFYWLQNGGTVEGATYRVRCKVITSKSQKFEDVFEVNMLV